MDFRRWQEDQGTQAAREDIHRYGRLFVVQTAGKMAKVWGAPTPFQSGYRTFAARLPKREQGSC